MSYSRTLILLFILPMWVNILIRTLATVALFDFLRLPLGEGALIFGMIYNYLPFMIYPIYNTLQKMDRSYIEAAQDLGAGSSQVFWKVVFPLSMPGVVSGIVMVFMPTISTFAIAELLTMNNIKLFGTTIQENINNSLWNYGAALSLIMLFLIAVTSLFSTKIPTIRRKEEEAYGKEDHHADLSLGSVADAVCTHCDHCHLFVYGCQGAGQLDGFFADTL